MTIEEAKEELKDLEVLEWAMCDYCTANDFYCYSPCAERDKIKQIGYDRIIKSYARNNGDIEKVFQYIKRTKI